jgi:Flp pilus assembly protein TadG
MVEFALILPILILLIFGLVEFGQGYNAQITLTHAAREGVRTLAVTKDSGEAVQATKDAATSLNPDEIVVTPAPCNPGSPTSLTAAYPFTYDIPLFGTNTITLTGKGVMRCGG